MKQVYHNGWLLCIRASLENGLQSVYWVIWRRMTISASAIRSEL